MLTRSSPTLRGGVFKWGAMAHRRLSVPQATTCLLCGAIGWRFESPMVGTEFEGGWLTGPLLAMHFVGTLLFLLALVMTFIVRRTAAAIALLACLLCLPLYLFFTTPGPYRWIFGGEWLYYRASFVWDWPAVVGIVAVALAGYAAVRNLPAAVRKPSARDNRTV